MLGGMRTRVAKRCMGRTMVFGCVVLFGSASAAEGRFVVRETQVESPELLELAQALAGTGTLPQLAADLNERFVLPRDIGIRLRQCGEPNAYYDGERHEVQLCLELVGGIAEVLQPQFEDENDFTDAVAGAFIATALHEVGHALVHVLELPITGREEDAVDQLSAWLLIQGGESASVLGAAAAYYTDEDADDHALASEHSLDRQRYFNHLCWVYGSAPEAHAFLIEDWALPAARAERCADEYRRLERSWQRLLGEHLRTSLSASK